MFNECLTLVNNDRTWTVDSVQDCSHYIKLFSARLPVCFRDHLISEQFRPAIVFRLSDHDCRDEHFFSLFQVF
jgi:hypothetical protein